VTVNLQELNRQFRRGWNRCCGLGNEGLARQESISRRGAAKQARFRDVCSDFMQQP
jgi:hypothetical protein